MRKHFLSIVSVVLLTGMTSVANADMVLTIFTLDGADAATNRLTIMLDGGTAMTDLSGVIQAIVNIDPTTGDVTGLTLTGGPTTSPISSTDWSMATAGLGTVAGNSIGATTSTPAPPGAVAGGNFTASQHLLTLNTGTLSAGGGVVQDFSTEPFSMNGNGTGTLTSTAAGPGLFDLVLTFPINTNDTVLEVPISIAGNVVARSLTVAVPEPAQGLMLTSLVGLMLARRRRFRR